MTRLVPKTAAPSALQHRARIGIVTAVFGGMPNPGIATGATVVEPFTIR